MKKLNAVNLEKSLNRAEMKAITDGQLSGGGIGITTCYDSSVVFHRDISGNEFTCSTISQPESEDDCC